MIEVGEYVRTKQGEIGKIIRIIPDEEFNDEYYVCDNDSAAGLKSYIVKHSKNIIDLIEEGDYVNGEKITDIYYGNRISSNKSNFNEEDIKTIVTKKQFASMEYKVKE